MPFEHTAQVIQKRLDLTTVLQLCDCCSGPLPKASPFVPGDEGGQLFLRLEQVFARAHRPDEVGRLCVLVAVDGEKLELGDDRGEHLAKNGLADACLTDQ